MLGKYLKEYRLSHNLTQTQMAEKLETSQSYYSLMESGVRKPAFRTISKIAQLLNLEESFIRKLL